MLASRSLMVAPSKLPLATKSSLIRWHSLVSIAGRTARFLRFLSRRNRAVRPAILTNECQRISEDFVASGSFEGATIRVRDASIDGQRGRFGASRVINSVSCRERVDVVVVKIKVLSQRPQTGRIRQSRDWIFRSGFRQRDRTRNQALDAFA